MKTILLLLLFFIPIQAREFKASWDAFTPEEVTKMDGIIVQIRTTPDGPWIEHGRVDKNDKEYTAEFPDGDFEIAVTTFRKIVYSEPIDGEEESIVVSGLSRIAKVPEGSAIPKGFKISITIDFKGSEDLINWKSLAKITIPDIEAGPKQFFQAK